MADQIDMANDIAAQHLERSLTELARLGKLRDSGVRRKNGSGKSAIVWAPVYPKALQWQRIA